MPQPSRELQQQSLQWLSDNWEEICTLARVACSRRGRMDLYDELLNEAVDRVGSIYANHDATRSHMLTHVRCDLKWYFWKRLNAIEKYHNHHLSLDKVQVTDINDGGATLYGLFDSYLPIEADNTFAVDDAETVQYIMNSLSNFDRRLLEMRFVNGMTYEEMSDVIRVLSASSIKDKYLPLALKRAREAKL